LFPGFACSPSSIVLSTSYATEGTTPRPQGSSRDLPGDTVPFLFVRSTFAASYVSRRFPQCSLFPLSWVSIHPSVCAFLPSQWPARRRISAWPAWQENPIRWWVLPPRVLESKVPIPIDIFLSIRSKPPPKPFGEGGSPGPVVCMRIERHRLRGGGALGVRPVSPRRSIPEEYSFFGRECTDATDVMEIPSRADTSVVNPDPTLEKGVDRSSTEWLQADGRRHSQDKLSRVSTPVVGLVPDALAHSC